MSSAEPGLVVVGIDQEAKGYQKALEFAAVEANRRGTGVRLAHGCEPLAAFGELDPIPSMAEREHEQRALGVLETAAEAVRPALDPGGQVECRVWRRTGADALVEESKQAAIVVLQHRKLSHIRRFSTTSTTSRVARPRRNAPWPSYGRSTSSTPAALASQSVSTSPVMPSLLLTWPLLRPLCGRHR